MITSDQKRTVPKNKGSELYLTRITRAQSIGTPIPSQTNIFSPSTRIHSKSAGISSKESSVTIVLLDKANVPYETRNSQSGAFVSCYDTAFGTRCVRPIFRKSTLVSKLYGKRAPLVNTDPRDFSYCPPMNASRPSDIGGSSPLCALRSARRLRQVWTASQPSRCSSF